MIFLFLDVERELENIEHQNKILQVRWYQQIFVLFAHLKGYFSIWSRLTSHVRDVIFNKNCYDYKEWYKAITIVKVMMDDANFQLGNYDQNEVVVVVEVCSL